MTDAERLLRFAATFVWADHEVCREERRFLHDLARELSFDDPKAVEDLLDRPPSSDDIDPCSVPYALAPRVRDVVLRAIASDGAIEPPEMDLFFVLDELLPSSPSRATEPRIALS